MSPNIEIYVIEPANPPKAWKKEMGTIGWDGTQLYIPACYARMTPTEALLCAAHDGATCCWSDDVLLIPEPWARKERPEFEKVYDMICMTARLHLKLN